MAEENYINQRREQEAQQQRQSNLSWLLPWAAGIGAIAVGAKLLKSGLSEQGNLVANMLHFLGHPTSLKTQVGKLANTGASTPSSGTHGIRHLFNASYSVTRNELQLGPISQWRDQLEAYFQNYTSGNAKVVAEACGERKALDA